MLSSKKPLSGRVALVTGGTRGIGFSIAETLGRDGAAIAICGRNERDLGAAIRKLSKKGIKCRGYRANAGIPKEVLAVISGIKKDFKKLDILINNIGGVKQFSNFEGLSDEDWQEVFNDNILSMVRFTRAAFPLLKKSGKARIINISSLAGKRPGNFNPHYGAMKAAMIHTNKYLSNQWGKYGILVNAICPHTVKGGVWERDVKSKAKMFNLSFKEAERKLIEEVSSRSPLGAVAELSDVSELVAFLVSDKAKFITGTAISVDGGTFNSLL